MCVCVGGGGGYKQRLSMGNVKMVNHTTGNNSHYFL